MESRLTVYDRKVFIMIKRKFVFEQTASSGFRIYARPYVDKKWHPFRTKPCSNKLANPLLNGERKLFIDGFKYCKCLRFAN